MRISDQEEEREDEQWRLLSVTPLVAAGHGDGGDEQHGDQPGDHRDFEHADVYGVHPEEEEGQENAGHGQADGALEQVAAEDRQYGKGNQTDQ